MRIGFALTILAALSLPALAQSSNTSTATGAATGRASGQGSATAGSSGSAAIGGTSATTLGVGATSASGGQGASAMGMSGSAAATDGRTSSMAKVNGSRNLNGVAKAQAMDQGTFSKSMTHCKDKLGQDVECRTRTMAHQPGEKPVMSTTTSSGSAQ